MAASRHIHPGQLRMFMPAGELRAMEPNPSDRYDSEGGGPHPVDYMWAAKLDQAVADGTARSIKDEGVRRPVHVFHAEEGDQTVPGGDPLPRGEVLAHGHHRVAAAAFLNPDQLVPVKHYDERNASAAGWGFTQAVLEGK